MVFIIFYDANVRGSAFETRGARRSNTQRRQRKGVFVSAAAARRRAPVFLGGGVKP